MSESTADVTQGHYIRNKSGDLTSHLKMIHVRTCSNGVFFFDPRFRFTLEKQCKLYYRAWKFQCFLLASCTPPWKASQKLAGIVLQPECSSPAPPTCFAVCSTFAKRTPPLPPLLSPPPSRFHPSPTFGNEATGGRGDVL